MHQALVTTGHLEKKNIIVLDENIPDIYKYFRIVLEPQDKPIVQRKAGILQGKITMSDDFDSPFSKSAKKSSE